MQFLVLAAIVGLVSAGGYGGGEGGSYGGAEHAQGGSYGHAEGGIAIAAVAPALPAGRTYSLPSYTRHIDNLHTTYKTVTKVRPVVVEKPVLRIVEKPYPVDRPVYVTRNVVKPVYVPKNVYVDRPVIVEKKVLRLVDRPVIKTQIVQKPVLHTLTKNVPVYIKQRVAIPVRVPVPVHIHSHTHAHAIPAHFDGHHFEGHHFGGHHLGGHHALDLGLGHFGGHGLALEGHGHAIATDAHYGGDSYGEAAYDGWAAKAKA